MSSPDFYDDNMRNISREYIRVFLKFYIEQSFTYSINKDIPKDFVIQINEYLMSIEDEDTTDAELVNIYKQAIRSLKSAKALDNFYRLPIDFLRNELGVPYGEDFS